MPVKREMQIAVINATVVLFCVYGKQHRCKKAALKVLSRGLGPQSKQNTTAM